MTAALLDAFGRVRVAAEQYMDERDRTGLGWVEESVTDIAVHKGFPRSGSSSSTDSKRTVVSAQTTYGGGSTNPAVNASECWSKRSASMDRQQVDGRYPSTRRQATW